MVWAIRRDGNGWPTAASEVPLLPSARPSRRAAIFDARRKVEKPLFDLRVNALEPLLGALRPLSVGLDFRLELSDAILRNAELARERLRLIKRMPIVFFDDDGSFVQQTQDGLPGVVKVIAATIIFALPR
jgi:hypothetical protein